uniref:Uncharacterized protein n=1 Tax=Romanomermis culicivorax TaxID=13658 RepID=A0A915KBS9_ROMCU
MISICSATRFHDEKTLGAEWPVEKKPKKLCFELFTKSIMLISDVEKLICKKFDFDGKCINVEDRIPSLVEGGGRAELFMKLMI